MGHSGIGWRRARFGMAAWAIAAACATTLSACGGNSSDNSAGSSSKSSSGGAYTASSLAKAKAAVAPYLKPSPIPVKQPLSKQPPPGSKVVFVSCKSPECQQFVPGLKAAAAAAGVQFEQVLAGTSAQDVNSAFESAAQMKPLAIIDPALDPSLWRQASKHLKVQGTPVVGHAVVEPAGDNFAATVMGPAALQKWGRLQADFVYTRTGNKSRAVYLNTPEFAIFGPMATSFKSELSSLCSSCDPQILNIPAASLGTTASSKIVSYLQAHPDIKWVVTSAPSQVFGLPPALKAAGLKVHIMSDGGLPQNYQYIKAGQQDADISVDYGQDTWLMMDRALRAGTGEKIAPDQQGLTASQQILTANEMNFDLAKGWTAFPDYQSYFKKLWTPAS
jgi:ribose transport system substrate-binding protein